MTALEVVVLVVSLTGIAAYLRSVWRLRQHAGKRNW